MKRLTLLLVTLILTACQSTPSNDPSSLRFAVPGGSTLNLNKSINIPAGLTHVVVQKGKLTTENKRDHYSIACSLNFREFGPRTIKPEAFNILRTEEDEGWVSRPNIYFYTTEIYLGSEKGTDVIKMVCGTWAMPPSVNFSYSELEQTFGDYFSFSFNFPDSPKP